MDVHQRHGDVEEISKKLDECLSVDDEQVETYRRLIQDGKNVGRQGDMKEALRLFRLAFDIRQSEKLKSRIQRIEDHLAEEDEEEEDDDFVNVNGSGLMLFKDLHDKLYGYQRDGVAFLYGLHRDGRRGGILADDMGLGKTIQVISFLSGMYDAELAKHTLLVMPTSLITNWTKEFAKWTPGMRVKDFHGPVKERTRNLEKVQRRGGVLLTTYTMVMNNWQQLSAHRGAEFTWDYVILDEAHKIKTASTKTAKSVYAVSAKNRVLLTGTPVQNNLKEMWALFDFACRGTLLGTAKTFKTEYENPITRAREKDATPGEKALGARMSEDLVARITPHFLRRTKAEVNKTDVSRREEDDGRAPEPPKDSGAAMPALKRKNDLIVWTYLSAVQEDVYRQFISLDHIKELLMTTRSPLAELNIMKKLCDHPRLFSAAAVAKLGLADGRDGDQPGAAGSIADVPDDTLIAESGKMVFLFALLERLRDEGHRTLVFARYRKVLDIIQRILGNRGFKVMRLDGTVTQLAERERLITRFQTDASYSVFLLTTQVGGVGITLTAADRVVIYDPSWNPATDAQAVDRAYRIGQTDNVVIYRLITCGTVEEKIYRRQVFKDSLIRQSTGDKKNPFRYFSKQELKELFVLEDTRRSSTQLQLQALHSRHRRTDPELDEHIARLHAMEMFGITDHDLMFSLDVEQDEAPEDREAQHYIEGRVQKAQELMEAESELQRQLAESVASGTEPAWLRQQEPDDNGRERKTDPRPGPSFPRHDVSGSPGAEPDRSGSDLEGVRPAAGPVIDLTADESVASDDEVVNLEGNRDERPAVKRERSATEVIEESSVTAEEAMEESLLIQESLVAARDPMDRSGAAEGDGVPAFSAPLNRRLSVLKPDASSPSGLESFGGNFNLQLEESDLFSDREEAADPEEEEEERKLLLQLQADGSFDIYKSLNESRHRRASLGHASDPDGSIVATKKRRAAVIYDSDDDEEEEEEEEGQLNNSFQVLGASTPKSGPAPLRKSLGGNASVASRRSFILSMMEDIDLGPVGEEEEQEEQEEEKEKEEEEEEEEEEEVSGKHSYEEEIIGLTRDELQLEETAGETLNTEEEEESGQEGEGSSNMDESGQEGEESSVPELASDEKMDQCTAGVKTKGIGPSEEEEEESFLSLVRKGKERKSEGKLDEALSFFLRAIDLQPGDPEVQLMTIQLYRQQSR
ncbi:DNA excision repair protein ERCC-6-like isoform X1 [Clinocottus analis]|uniref:DNA excision repair protein ERCC-6-like isoform X1 n=1 Tax=Clinocottus analis TaxID=304258 RepID=UPI0035C09015